MGVAIVEDKFRRSLTLKLRFGRLSIHGAGWERLSGGGSVLDYVLARSWYELAEDVRWLFLLFGKMQSYWVACRSVCISCIG